MVYEVYRGLYYQEYIYFLLGGTTSVLSTLCHMHHEKKYENIESLVAKVTLIYPILTSIYYFTTYQIFFILFWKFCLVFTWYFLQDLHYEKIHPWLHIIVAIDAHYYIDCWNEYMM